MIAIDLWADDSKKGGNKRHVVGQEYTLGTVKVRSLKGTFK